MALTLAHTPDLLAVLSDGPTMRARRRGLGLTELELADGIAAVLDRADTAGPEERARLGRVRDVLETELARLNRL